MKIAVAAIHQKLLHHSCFFTLVATKTAYDGFNYNKPGA